MALASNIIAEPRGPGKTTLLFRRAKMWVDRLPERRRDRQLMQMNNSKIQKVLKELTQSRIIEQETGIAVASFASLLVQWTCSKYPDLGLQRAAWEVLKQEDLLYHREACRQMNNWYRFSFPSINAAILLGARDEEYPYKVDGHMFPVILEKGRAIIQATLDCGTETIVAFGHLANELPVDYANIIVNTSTGKIIDLRKDDGSRWGQDSLLPLVGLKVLYSVSLPGSENNIFFD